MELLLSAFNAGRSGGHLTGRWRGKNDRDAADAARGAAAGFVRHDGYTAEVK